MTFNFLAAHDVLRCVLENDEVLKVATNVLEGWLQRYYDQQMKVGNGRLPEEAQYDSLVATMQLLANNQHRNTAMQLRLENEISLGFNQASQQEARTMRIVSVVTAMFLPATFISTLFSMSFFNFFDPGQPTPTWGVTKEIWTYFAFAGPLTVLALLAVSWTAVVEAFKRWSHSEIEMRTSRKKERIHDAEKATH